MVSTLAIIAELISKTDKSALFTSLFSQIVQLTLSDAAQLGLIIEEGDWKKITTLKIFSEPVSRKNNVHLPIETPTQKDDHQVSCYH